MERYESLGPVGEGSYGTVLKCRHRDSGRIVAIKKFLDSDQDKTVKKIALREVKLLRQLRHENLVNLLEVWKRRHRWYLVFQFVDRTLLEDLEQYPNGLDLSTCRTYLFQVLRAVEFCHQQNVIHRDIKPENILISQDGVVKLCDFGFARTLLSPSEGGVYTDYVATRWYRAPELLVGDIKYGKPVDVWALGCLVIEMLTGQPLFPGDSDLDQIHHIVRCFGDLMAHHQEVFYQNPVFSGVSLPKCSSTVSLQQRFPKIPPTPLHLAERCLEMDPERRAQCSELLEHSFFTQDSFHIRFLDLNAKIQKEHRENSTFPQITKTPRSETNKGDEKNCRGKDKKQPEDTDQRVNTDKTDKPKGKQTSKLYKTNRNTKESLVSTQPKTFGNKIVHNTTQYPTKTKPEKPTCAGIKSESEASKTTKTFISNSADDSEAAVTLKKKNQMTTKLKQESFTPPEPRKDLPQNAKDMNCCGPGPEKNMSISKSEPNQEFPKSWSNPTMKVSPTMLHDPKSYKTSSGAEFQFELQEAESKSPKVLPKNQKTTLNSGPTPNTNILNSSSKNFPLHLSQQSSTEASSIHNTPAVPKEPSSLKVSKVEFTSRALSKDRELIDYRDFRSCHGYLNPVTEIPEGAVLLSQTSDGSFKSSLEKNAKDDRFTLNLVGTSVLKVTDSSEKENQDLASQSVSISSTNQPVKQTLKASENSGTAESEVDSFKVPHPKPNPLKTHQHTRSSMIPKTQKPTPTPDAKKKSDRNGLTISRDSTLFLTSDQKASTEGFKSNTSDLTAPRSSTPSPPPPFSNPMLLPPSSQPLMSSLSVFNNPAAGDYLVQGAGFHPGTNSLRCVDHCGTCDRPTQQFSASKLTGSFTVLASEKSFINETAKTKSNIHFPEIRSSTLPELREKEGECRGKHNKGAIKNLRKDKNLVSSSPPSEGQQGHRTNLSTTKL